MVTKVIIIGLIALLIASRVEIHLQDYEIKQYKTLLDRTNATIKETLKVNRELIRRNGILNNEIMRKAEKRGNE